jgi:hypothetical protein
MSAAALLGAQPAAAAATCSRSNAPVTDYNGRTFTYRYYCSTYVPQALYWNVNSADTRLFDDSGYMYKASSVWVICQFVGRENPAIQYNHNNRWLYTWGDESRSEAGPYGNGWGFIPATAVSQGGEYENVPGVPLCSSVNSSVIPAASSSPSIPFPTPLGGWIAKKNGVNTDPVNVVVSYKGGNALETLLFGMALGGSGWDVVTLCYNDAVKLNTDHTLKSPNAVWASDTFGDCGWPGSERNHARFWTTESADEVFVWIAASYEHFCGLNHCISANGFNRGRADLSLDIVQALANQRITYAISTITPYSAGSINTPEGAISYSGQVNVIRITWAPEY